MSTNAEHLTPPTPSPAHATTGWVSLVGALAYLSRRYWRRRRGSALLSLSGIALGVGLMVAVVAVNQAVLRTYDSWATTIAGRSQIEVRSVESNGMAAEWVSRVRALEGVRIAAPVVEQRSYLFTDSNQASVTLTGVDPASDSEARLTLSAAGRALTRGDRGVVTLSQPAAASLDVGVGDVVSLLTTEGVASLRVVGIEQPSASVDLARERTATITLPDAREAFMQGRQVVTRIDVLATDPSVIDKLRSDLDELFAGAASIRLPVDELRDLALASRGLRFLLLLSGAMALVAAAFLVATNLFAAVEDRGRDVAVLRGLGVPGRRAGAWLLVEAASLGMAGSVVGAAAGVWLAIGLLARMPTALLGGVSSAAVTSFPLGLVLLLGVVTGVVIALGVTWPIALRVSTGGVSGEQDRSSLVAPQAVPRGARRARRVLVPLALAGALGVGGFGGLLGGWFGGALTSGQVQAIAATLQVLVLGWAAVSSFPLLVNRLGASVRHLNAPPLWLRLAADSMRRHSRRSGATAISLMITVAGLVGVYGAVDSYRSSLTAWLDASVSWDLMVSSGPPGAGPTTPLPSETAQVVAAVPGVAAALPERSVTVSSQGRAVPIVAFDATAEMPSRALRAGEMAPGWRGTIAKALSQPGTVALSTALAARLEVDAGQHLPLTTHAGEANFLVVAVVEDPAADGGGRDGAAAYVDIGRFAQTWDDTSVDEIGVRLDAGVDIVRAAAAVAAAVRTSLGHPANSRLAATLDPGQSAGTPVATVRESAELVPAVPVQVVRAAAYREEMLDGVRDTFVVIRTLVMLAVLVAVAGLLNAILVGFWQLRHQLGLLRALGAPVKLLARTVAAEAALTAVAGGGAGLLLGTLLSLALLRGMDSTTGPLLVWSPPLQAYVTVAGLLAAAAVVAGSLLDSRARATPVQAVVRGE